MRFITKALVLNIREIGESDLFVVLLSPKWGRFTALAKGARRSKRRFVNALEPFTLLVAHLRGGKPGLAPFLDQVDLLEHWEPLRLDPWRFALATYLAELVEYFAQPRSGENLFALLLEAFNVLCQVHPEPAFKLSFELKLLKAAGFAPELERCIRCQAENTPLLGFSLEDGGTVCRQCLQEQDIVLSPKQIAVLRTLQRYPLTRLKRIQLPAEALPQSAGLIEKFLVRILGYDVKSLRIWKELRRMSSASAQLARKQ